MTHLQKYWGIYLILLIVVAYIIYVNYNPTPASVAKVSESTFGRCTKHTSQYTDANGNQQTETWCTYGGLEVDCNGCNVSS